jgi:hypothetical protein
VTFDRFAPQFKALCQGYATESLEETLAHFESEVRIDYWHEQEEGTPRKFTVSLIVDEEVLLTRDLCELIVEASTSFSENETEPEYIEALLKLKQTVDALVSKAKEAARVR